MESDLEMVIKNSTTVLSPADVKAYMQMLLEALKACHEQWIVHRDIKPNNFLVSSTGKLFFLQLWVVREMMPDFISCEPATIAELVQATSRSQILGLPGRLAALGEDTPTR